MQHQIVGMLSGYGGLDQVDWLWKQTPHPFGTWGEHSTTGDGPPTRLPVAVSVQFSPAAAPQTCVSIEAVN
jgi:hypothetical protein